MNGPWTSLCECGEGRENGGEVAGHHALWPCKSHWLRMRVGEGLRARGMFGTPVIGNRRESDPALVIQGPVSFESPKSALALICLPRLPPVESRKADWPVVPGL